MSTRRIARFVLWTAIAVAGASALGGIALHRGESINALWFVVAAVCTYLVGYRFYSGWIAARVCQLDPTRATPAERLDNGRDFVPTHRSIVSLGTFSPAFRAARRAITWQIVTEMSASSRRG